MLKYYSFDAYIRRNKKIHKSFISREKANMYLDKILDKLNTEVCEINQNNHDIEYLLKNNTKICINRHIIV